MSNTAQSVAQFFLVLHPNICFWELVNCSNGAEQSGNGFKGRRRGTG